MVIIVNLGAPIRVLVPGGGWSCQPDGFFAGMHDTFAITETDGAQRGVQIDLTPTGAHLPLRVPMHELTGRVVELDEFFLARLDDALSPVPTVTRDFHQFAGSSPSDFARRRLPDGGGVVGD